MIPKFSVLLHLEMCVCTCVHVTTHDTLDFSMASPPSSTATRFSETYVQLSASPRTQSEAIVLSVHSALLANGFVCIGTAETSPDEYKGLPSSRVQ